jgi:TRAP-type transport system small permease protein
MTQPNKHLRIDHLIAAALLFAMAAIAFANVISRYLFHFSFSATEEITINLFVWLTVAGSGIAFERGGQLGMVTLFKIFPRKTQKAVVIFSAVLSAALFIIVDIFMIQAIYDEITLFEATSPGLGIPVWIYYTGVPVLSVFVFKGIYKNAAVQLTGLKPDQTSDCRETE